jgi:Flp pilus assembly protein TadG
MKLRVSSARSERGAVLVQVGLALIALLAFGAFVIDYGVLWASRGQAQNAADAAALAGAVSMAYDGATDREAAARANASSIALAHRVWGQAPAITAITFPPCPDDGSNACIQVDLSRPDIPTFLARLVSVNAQSVRATATAKAGYGNSVECIKPFAVADKWQELRPVSKVWETTDFFDKYDKQGNLLSGIVDNYVPPTATDPGTGFAPFDENGNKTTDYGLLLTLKIGSPNDASQLTSGWFMPLALPGDKGGSDYRYNIGHCYATPTLVGSSVDTLTEPGNMIGPTKQGIQDLVDQDPGAYWDTSTKSVKGSAYPVSPRIVPIPLINVDEYFFNSKNGRTDVHVVNLLGFFVNRMNGQDVEGYLCAIPGNLVGESPIGDQSSFVRTIQLVR